MGVEPYLIGAALNMVLAQRLVRRICGKCREPYEPPRTIRKALERMGYEIDEFYRGVGCKRCRNTGYSGRIGIHELLIMDDELCDAVVGDPSIGAIRGIAQRRRHGYAAARRLPQGPRRNHHDRRSHARGRRGRDLAVLAATAEQGATPAAAP